MTYWTLEYNGTEKALGAWGFSDPDFSAQSMGVDEFNVNALAVPFADPPIIPKGGRVIVRRARTLAGNTYGGGSIYFQGVCSDIPRFGTTRREGHSYTFSGPWYWLENKTYQQKWNLKAGQSYTSHLLLGISDTGYTGPNGAVFFGIHKTVKELVKEVVAARLATIPGPAPFQVTDESFSPTHDQKIPIDEIRDVTFAEAIKRLFRWHPDTVGWTDYATEPPTLMFTRRADLTPATVRLGNRPLREIGSIVPKYDLQKSRVMFRFEMTSEVDGQQQNVLLEQSFPPGTTGIEEDAFVQTFELAGSKTTHIEQSLAVQPFRPGAIGWWTNRFESLNGTHISNPRLKVATVRIALQSDNEGVPEGSIVWQSQSDSFNHPEDAGAILPCGNEIIDGAWHKWMGGDAVKYDVRGEIIFDAVDPETKEVVKKDVHEFHHARVTATTLPSNLYRSVSSYEDGDNPASFAGIAQRIHEAISVLQWEFTLKLSAEEVPDLLTLGNSLNILGGLPEWETMNASIYSLAADLENGDVTVRGGPAKYLGAGELLDLIKASRFRQRWTMPEAMKEGVDGGAVAMNNKVMDGRNSTTQGQSSTLKVGVKTSAGPVVLDPMTGNKFPSKVEIGGDRITLDPGALPANIKMGTTMLPICIGDETYEFWLVGGLGRKIS